METQHEPANLKIRLKTTLHQIAFSAAQSNLLFFFAGLQEFCILHLLLTVGATL